MAVGFSNTNKPINPRGLDASPKGYNRAALYSGKALDFDGVNDEVNIGAVSGTFSNLSMSWYIKTTYTADFQCLFADGAGNFDVYVRPDKKLHVWTGSQQSFYEIPDIQTGEWVNLVLVKDGANASLYYNGQLAQTIAFSGSSFSISNGFVGIGLNSLYDYNGEMAGFKIFNTALTAAQVADLYNNPEKIVPTGVEDTALKLWLPMMEGAGTTAYDGSGNGNHGTISGATWTHGIGAPVAQSAVIDWNKSHNYIDKSEEFETAFWTENRLVPITNDSFIAPDGSATATEIVENTANDSHFLAQTLSVTAGDYFISIFAKKRDYDWFQISTGGDISRYSNFNLTTGALGNSDGFTDRFIEDYGNGWYRVGGKITTSATSFNFFPTLIQSDVASRFDTYAGTDKGTYIWGAQATKSATLKPYLRNIGTAAITDDVLLPQGLTSGRDITGVNLFENVRKQGALNLDGNSWAEVHDNASLDITDAITLEAWVYWDDSSNKGILGRWHSDSLNRNYLLYKQSATNLNFYINSVAPTSYTGLNGSKGWTHIVGTYDRTNAILYIDGVGQTPVAHTAAISTGTFPIEIGRNFTTANQALTNDIAQPRIYNRALTASEVLRNYNSGKSTYQ